MELQAVILRQKLRIIRRIASALFALVPALAYAQVQSTFPSANQVYAGPPSGSAAQPSFRTLLPADLPTALNSPFSVGTSLYPVLNGFEYNATSALGANTIGAKNIVVGVPAATSTCCTWLNTYLSGVDVVGITTLYSIATPGTSALWTTVTAARSSDTSSVGVQNIIPSNCVEVHDNTSVGHQNWCGYDAAYITATAAHGRTLGREISVFNTGAASTAEDPFNFNPTVPSSETLRLDCAAAGGFGGNDCGAALATVPNGAKYVSGIIIANGSLDTGSNANPDALALPNTYAITWYNAAAAKTWQLFGGSGANGNLNFLTSGTGALTLTSNQNATLSFQASNTNAGASAGSALTTSSNAGTASLNATSTAGGAAGILRWTGSSTFFLDALNATGSFNFRTGATPTSALTISSGQVLNLPAVTTGTPAASLCIDGSNNIIKKTTTGSCI